MKSLCNPQSDLSRSTRIPAELQKALDAAGCQNPILVSTKTSEGLLELTHALQEQLTKLYLKCTQKE